MGDVGLLHDWEAKDHQGIPPQPMSNGCSLPTNDRAILANVFQLEKDLTQDSEEFSRVSKRSRICKSKGTHGSQK